MHDFNTKHQEQNCSVLIMHRFFQLVLKISAVTWQETHSIHIVYGQNVEFLNGRGVGIHSNYCTWYGKYRHNQQDSAKTRMRVF
jgi:hypothetical protein